MKHNQPLNAAGLARIKGAIGNAHMLRAYQIPAQAMLKPTMGRLHVFCIKTPDQDTWFCALAQGNDAGRLNPTKHQTQLRVWSNTELDTSYSNVMFSKRTSEILRQKPNQPEPTCLAITAPIDELVILAQALVKAELRGFMAPTNPLHTEQAQNLQARVKQRFCPDAIQFASTPYDPFEL